MTVAGLFAGFERTHFSGGVADAVDLWKFGKQSWWVSCRAWLSFCRSRRRAYCSHAVFARGMKTSGILFEVVLHVGTLLSVLGLFSEEALGAHSLALDQRDGG